ncbi:MAG: hypothetical protein R3E01_10390 [Pirellulaceae bacterium]
MKKMGHISARIDPNLWRRVLARIGVSGESKTAFLTKAIRLYLDAVEGGPAPDRKLRAFLPTDLRKRVAAHLRRTDQPFPEFVITAIESFLEDDGVAIAPDQHVANNREVVVALQRLTLQLEKMREMQRRDLASTIKHVLLNLPVFRTSEEPNESDVDEVVRLIFNSPDRRSS